MEAAAKMDAAQPITLVLVDDHGIVREGVAAFCAGRPDLKILGQGSDGSKKAVDLIIALKPDFPQYSTSICRRSAVWM